MLPYWLGLCGALFTYGFEDTMKNKLSKEDQDRVDKYLNSGFNTTERKPFYGLRLLGGIWIVVAALGWVSWYIGKQAGYL